MQRVGNSGRHTSSGVRTVAAAVSLVALVGLAACTSSGSKKDAAPSDGKSSAPGSSSSAPSTSASSSSSAAAGAAVITTATVGGSQHANPAKPVVVKVSNGKLTSVKLVNAKGKVVAGSLATDGLSWQSTEALGYAKTYDLTADAQDPDGAQTVKRDKITTVTPDNMTMPYFQNISGGAMDNGATYGVGMVVGLHFDEQIPDQKATLANLSVTTTPKVEGAWYWTSPTDVHWRPKAYYAPGTKVTVAANVYGQDLGKGLYGESDVKTSFVIGQKRLAVADAKTHHVKVYFDGTLVKNMPTSMGQGGYIEGGKIALWTMPGIYTVITHENPAIMSSDSYGLPASSPYGYHGLVVPWATKISTDGIYLHELDSTVGVQGHQNVSHGCLNLNEKNAKWYYQHSRVGDVVQVVHSGGPKIKIWQGGDWSVPWATWVKGGLS